MDLRTEPTSHVNQKITDMLNVFHLIDVFELGITVYNHASFIRTCYNEKKEEKSDKNRKLKVK